MQFHKHSTIAMVDVSLLSCVLRFAIQRVTLATISTISPIHREPSSSFPSGASSLISYSGTKYSHQSHSESGRQTRNSVVPSIHAHSGDRHAPGPYVEPACFDRITMLDIDCQSQAGRGEPYVMLATHYLYTNPAAEVSRVS